MVYRLWERACCVAHCPNGTYRAHETKSYIHNNCLFVGLRFVRFVCVLRSARRRRTCSWADMAGAPRAYKGLVLGLCGGSSHISAVQRLLQDSESGFASQAELILLGLVSPIMTAVYLCYIYVCACAYYVCAVCGIRDDHVYGATLFTTYIYTIYKLENYLLGRTNVLIDFSLPLSVCVINCRFGQRSGARHQKRTSSGHATRKQWRHQHQPMCGQAAPRPDGQMDDAAAAHDGRPRSQTCAARRAAGCCHTDATRPSSSCRCCGHRRRQQRISALAPIDRLHCDTCGGRRRRLLVHHRLQMTYDAVN